MFRPKEEVPTDFEMEYPALKSVVANLNKKFSGNIIQEKKEVLDYTKTKQFGNTKTGTHGGTGF